MSARTSPCTLQAGGGTGLVLCVVGKDLAVNHVGAHRSRTEFMEHSRQQKRIIPGDQEADLSAKVGAHMDQEQAQSAPS